MIKGGPGPILGVVQCVVLFALSKKWSAIKTKTRLLLIVQGDAAEDAWSLREEAVAGVEGVVDLLEDHFGFPVPRSPQVGGQPAVAGGPAEFTFDTKVGDFTCPEKYFPGQEKFS